MSARCGGIRPAATSGFIASGVTPLLHVPYEVMEETIGEGDTAGGSEVFPDDGISD